MQDATWASLVNLCGFAGSKGEAKRLIKGRGVKWEETVIENADETIPANIYANGSFLLRVGKKKFKKIQVI